MSKVGGLERRQNVGLAIHGGLSIKGVGSNFLYTMICLHKISICPLKSLLLFKNNSEILEKYKIFI